MPELKHVFDLSTRHVEPDSDAWQQQEARQRKASRNRRLGGYAVGSGLAITVVLLATMLARDAGPGTGTVTGTPPPTALTLPQLHGVWFEEDGSHLLSIGLDGSYALDDTGLLDTDPDDLGTVAINADGSVRFVSVGASRACPPGDAWVWRSAVITGSGQLEVSGATTACTAAREGSSSWRLAGARSPLDEPVPGPDKSDGRPVTEADLVGFWVNESGPGLFRFAADGSFAGYLPETLDDEPIVAGTWEVRGGRIRQIYGSSSSGCSPGDVLVMEAEVVELDGTVALRTDVVRSCGQILPPPVTVRVSPR